MDNELSELSKPVAEVVSKFGDPEAFGEREIKLLTGIQQMAYGTKFYSQEYVSALLVELERYKQYAKERDAENESLALTAGRLRVELEAKDNRITELEAKTAMTMGVGSGNGNLFVHGDYDSIKAAQAIVLENESLRAKLATPVRLPTAMFCPEEYVGSLLWSETEAHNKAISKCAEGIRAAGLKVEGMSSHDQ